MFRLLCFCMLHFSICCRGMILFWVKTLNRYILERAVRVLVYYLCLLLLAIAYPSSFGHVLHRRRTATARGKQSQTKAGRDTQRQTETCKDRQRRTETAQRIIRNTDKEFPHVPHAVAWGCKNPHHTTSYRITPHHTTSQHITPHHTTSHHITLTYARAFLPSLYLLCRPCLLLNCVTTPKFQLSASVAPPSQVYNFDKICH